VSIEPRQEMHAGNVSIELLDEERDKLDQKQRNDRANKLHNTKVPFPNAMMRITKTFDTLLPGKLESVAASPLFQALSRLSDLKDLCGIIYLQHITLEEAGSESGVAHPLPLASPVTAQAMRGLPPITGL